MKKEKDKANSGSVKVDAPAGKPNTGTQTSGHEDAPQRVLIYDDDLEILFLCKEILPASQYHVETLSHCEDVISDVERIKPDIIFMDLWIPTIGGEKAVMLLKENTATKNIPVILFSANGEIKQISHRIKADGYLEKPFGISRFREIIKTGARK